MALKDQPELQHRPFAARELKVMHRGGKRRPARTERGKGHKPSNAG
jgi:hypothetical protein